MADELSSIEKALKTQSQVLNHLLGKVGEVGLKVGRVSLDLVGQRSKTEELQGQVDYLATTVIEIKEPLESNTDSLMNIEQTLGAIKDGYDLTKERTEKLADRVGKVEDHLGLSKVFEYCAL